MPNDADSLTEPDVDEPSEPAGDDQGAGEVVDPVFSDPAPGDDAAHVAAPADGAEPGSEPDGDVAAASPFGDELRLPDEHGYDGLDYSDEDDYLEDRWADDEPYDEDAYDEDAYFDVAHAATGGDEPGHDLLFDGDPDEFELEFGPAGGQLAPGPRAGDVLVLDDAAAFPGAPPPRRMSRMERRRRVRLQARRVRRIIRHVEPWSVLKISIFFYACLWVIFLVAGFMIWGVAESSGTVDKIESLILDLFALDTFDFDAGQIFRGYALGGLALSIAGTTFNVLMCLLFNLISDLTGGLRITMIEEESARPIPPRRRRRRRPPARRPPARR